MILASAISSQYSRVTNRQTDRQQTIYHDNRRTF